MGSAKYETIDGYLAAVADEQRRDLESLRELVRERYPEATEHISYSQPLFKLDGYAFVGFYAAKRHSSFFVWSDKTLGRLAGMLEGYDTAESTIRFQPGKPLPRNIVTAIMDERAEEIRGD